VAETEAAALGRTAAETSPPPGRSATSRIAPPDGGNGTDQGVDPLVDLRLYLDTVYGHAGEAPDEPIGYVHVGSGTQARFTETGSYRHRYFTEYAFEWPRQRHALETRIRGELAAHADVYVTPYLLKRGKGHRNKGTTVERLHVHTDVDGDVDMDRVRALGALAVDSGSPGHAQVYVRLSAPVDVRTHEQLCRLLCRHLGGDKGKVSDNDYLRPRAPSTGRPRSAANSTRCHRRRSGGSSGPTAPKRAGIRPS
jgi:hypothetical protein